MTTRDKVIQLSQMTLSWGLALGCAFIVVGAFMVGGLGWAVLATGVLIAGASLVITYDDKPAADGEPSP